MTDSITPPPELVQQWIRERDGLEHLAIRAAQWGADQELEACCEWTQGYAECGDSLRAARRPKPLSLKEQALEALGPEPLPKTGPTGNTILNAGTIERHRLVRNALEALPND